MKQVPDRKKLRRVDRGGNRKKPRMAVAVIRWLITILFCLMVWGVAFPIFGETAAFGDVAWMLGIAACILIPVLVISVSSTGKIIRRAREEFLPEVYRNTLPAEEILVRGSEEPPTAQSEVLLRAAEVQETPKEELLRVSQE